MTGRLYLDLSIIQSLPPSNVNRDDSGSPKHAEFGGVKRARISSQSQKRHARMHFAATLPGSDQATRTSRVQRLLTDRLINRHQFDADDAARLAAAAADSFGIKRSASNPDNLAYLLFAGHRQFDAMTDLIADQRDAFAAADDKTLVKAMSELKLAACLGSGNPAEVALFGRMVADSTDLNVDAAVQVAHAVSTHRVHNKFDYFTAVDDENRDSSGAGMVGNIEFNSATYYRYATLAVHQLHTTLGDPALTAQTAAGFTRGFTLALPTGHQNSFAHHTRPHAVVAAFRTDQPVNLVNAFEDPVAAHHDTGFAARSVTKLAAEFATAATVWGQTPEKVLATYAAADDATLAAQFGASLSFPDLTDHLEANIAAWLTTGELQ
jgi:CRISPR system Cascade subunit CasC